MLRCPAAGAGGAAQPARGVSRATAAGAAADSGRHTGAADFQGPGVHQGR